MYSRWGSRLRRRCRRPKSRFMKRVVKKVMPAASRQQPAPFFVLTYIYRLCETHRVSTSAMGFDELIRALVMATACTNGRLIRQREELRQVAKRLTTYA